MGKILVIKGANFSANAVDTQDISGLTKLEWGVFSVNADGSLNTGNKQQCTTNIVPITAGATTVTMNTTVNRYLTFVFYQENETFISRNVITQSGMSASCAVPANATKIRLMVGSQQVQLNEPDDFVAESGLTFTGIDAHL